MVRRGVIYHAQPGRRVAQAGRDKSRPYNYCIYSPQHIFKNPVHNGFYCHYSINLESVSVKFCVGA